MKDEIKEILDCIKDRTRDYVGMNGCLYQDLEREELNLLLNYITVLQEEIENQNYIIEKQDKDTVVLSKGNRELKERIDKAIEYIKEHTDKLKTIRVPKIDFNYNELLEILGDKENE